MSKGGQETERDRVAMRLQSLYSGASWRPAVPLVEVPDVAAFHGPGKSYIHALVVDEVRIEDVGWGEQLTALAAAKTPSGLQCTLDLFPTDAVYEPLVVWLKELGLDRCGHISVFLPRTAAVL